MSTLTIRNVEDHIHQQLREIAARNGRSVEAEVRALIADYVAAPKQNILEFLYANVGENGADLELPSREEYPREIDFS
ncbi:FitA-like ribbon-helix-helix domain-containing protein [Corynebacterium sp. H130]|uniref:FitA-like ribbon-helix-helix domain-containing protein n=1 Tax=Corynebacterium sp. H130 TaxID=3133444 RepID=UPI0030B66E2F